MRKTVSVFLLTVMIIMNSTLLSAALYDFDGTISCQTLEAYLARAIVMSGVCCDGGINPATYPEDNLRAIANVKPKYIGRAALAWGCPPDDELHFGTAREMADRIHAIDPDIILQACVFESVYSCKSPEALKAGRKEGVENIPVPAWAFEAFGLQPEDRCFDYEAMLFPEGRYRNFWTDGASVPDVTRQETQLWFYYRARRYIDAGYESIHFGQADLVGQLDEGRKVWTKLLSMVREYARAHARRHYALCDAHFFAKNAKVGDKYLWDFHAFPLRPVTGTKPFEASLAIGHGDAGYETMPPGIHPAGWECDVIPSLYEVDNFFGGIDGRPFHHVWGTDEISWFANCSEEYRNRWLVYAADWLKNNVRRGYMSVPGIRPATVPLGSPRRTGVYRFNTRSEACPEGFDQEETVKELFARPFEWTPIKPQKAPKPKKGELLGYTPGKDTFEETFKTAWYTDNSFYTDEALQTLFRAYGAFSPEEVKAAAQKEIEEKGLAKKPALLTKEGLRFDGTQILSLAAEPGPEMSLFLRIRLDDTAFANDIYILNKEEAPKSGFYIKYDKEKDEFFGEIFDGSGTGRRAVFPYPKDEREHVIGLVADGKALTAWLDGKKCASAPAGKMADNTLNIVIGENLTGCLIKDIKLFGSALADEKAKWMCR